LAAAALILLAFLSYVFVPQFNSGSSELAGNQAEMEIITTRRGQRTTLRLGDGTRVHLNAASMIKIPADFGDSTRDVYLKGEAYFEVTHNPQKPFLVHTPTAYTKVLGTKFGVKAYPEDTRVQVVVKEGRVALDLSATPDTTHNKIIKNHMGVLSPKGSLKISEVKELSSYLGWKDGRLVFKSTPFREMVPKLERWYDINIAVVDSSLNSRQMTASFKDEPVSEVLKIIALSLDAGYDRKGQEVTFHSN
jgi:ferric-dicitrate binding protein FerR (iron transport regulator)